MNFQRSLKIVVPAISIVLFFLVCVSYAMYPLDLFPSIASNDFYMTDSAESNMIILNVQSYPVLGGNWTVAFNTTGTANLTIAAVDGTTWSDSNEDNDFKFLEVRCGDQILDYRWINDSVFIENYSCLDTGYEISKVFTTGKHHLGFIFGEVKAYAHNLVIDNCTVLDSAGTIYYLSSDIINSANSTCMNITAENITLDCQGNTIDGAFTVNGDSADNKYAVFSDQYNTTIKNCVISGWQTGIYLDTGADNSKIENNTIQDLYGAIGADGSPGDPGGNTTGIYSMSDFITVFNNTISDMTAGNGGASSEGSGIGGLGGIATGICISNSTTSNLTSNSISGLTGGVGGDNDFSGLGGGGNGGPSIGICLSGSTDSIIFSNNISSMDGGAGKSGSYNDVSSGDGGPSTGIYLSNSTGNSIFFNNMSFLNGGAGGYNSCGAEYGGDGGASTGISLSSDSIGNNVSLNKIFSLTGGSGCSYGHEGGFKNKGGTGGTSWGVSLSNSINNTLSSNDIYLLRGGTGGAGGYEGSSGAGGMVAGSYIEDSINNTLSSNNIYSLTGGTGGPMTYKGYPGKGGMTTGSYIKDSINNTLFSNDIESIIGGSDYWGGVSSYFMYLYQANSTTIKDNAIKITDYGFYLYSTLDCLIYNNLVNVSASNPASFAGTIYRNFWNTTQQIGLRIYFSGHQIGGNYWTNPTGTGYSDTCMDSGEDGFCSNNYTLAANNTDYLPLSDGFNYNFLPPSPGDNSVLNQDWAYINVTTKDDESSDWIALEWNSTTNYTMDMGSFETNYYYNKTALVDGAYSYRVFANDSTGRMYVSKIRYLIIDIVTPPIISNLTYSESVFLGDGSTVIKIDVFDHSNVSSVWIEEDSTGMPENNSMSFESGTNDSGTYNYTLTYSSVGNISFKIYANDSLGNMQNTSSYMIYISDLSVSLNMDKFIYNLGEDITIFGNAISQSVNVTDNPISIWLDEKKLKLRYDGFLTESWGLSGWEYYRPVIIENTAGSLTDYLVLIQGNMSQTFSDGKVQQDCSDIRFTTNNLSEYTYAVSECNLAEDGVVNSWVNITLPNGNTTVYMFYGNPSANDTGTLWDNLWDNVSHLGIYGGLFSYNCSGYGDCFEDYDNPENYTDFYSKMNSNPEYSIDMQHKLGVSAGPFSHTCILKSNGSVECYGSSYSGFSGYNGGDAIGVTAGVWHMCILKSNGTVECFGQNNDGCAESYDGGDAVMVSAQEDNTCVLKSNGNVTCYGDNTYGQSNNYTGGDAIGVFAGGSLLTGKAHTCVLKSNGNVTCYGDNTYGQSYNYTGGDAIGISLSSMHTCILKLDGNVDCYGNNDYGQSSNYTGGDAISVSITEGHTCILKANGNVECYGDNAFGQSNNYTGEDAIGVSAGGMLFMGAYTCILKSDSNVECWGSNGQGQSNNYTGNDAKNPFRDYVSPEPVSYPGPEQLTTTDSDGNYNYTIEESLGDGTYILKVNLTDPNSYYGENQTTFVVDGTPPTIIMFYPENATSIPAGTTQKYINITTNENATCRYNTTDSGYENSTDFTSTGDKNHSFLYTGLSDENTYNLYYWCNDSYGHINANSTHHTFSVSSQTAYCGDGICNNGETCSTCSSDCGSCSSGGSSHQIPQDDQGEDEDNGTDEDDEIDYDEISDLTDDDLNQTLQQDDKDDGNKIEINETVAREYIEYVEALLSGLRGKGHKVIDEAAEMITLAWEALEDGSYEEAYDLARKAENMLIEQDTGIAGDDRLTGLFPAAYVLLLIALLALGAYLWLKRRDAAVSEPDDTLDLKSLVERMAVIERDEQEISHKLDVVKNLISGSINYLKRKK